MHTMFDVLRDKSKFEEVRTSEKYASVRKMLIDSYEEFSKKDLHISFDVETEFLKNGNRTEFQDKYFARRTILSICALLVIIYPDETKYISELEEIICCICNEYSWQLPAHRPKDNWNRRDDIDLFAAETGLYLVEIKYMLADRLNPIIVDRITKEVEWRIMRSFETNTFWWEDLKSNWASVCSGSVGSIFLYEDADRFEKISHRITACMENYLSGINDEGSTSEGAGYWSYGFSFYTLYHDLLRRHTGGRIDGFKSAKVKRLSGFLTSLYFDEDNVVLFSDAEQGTKYPIWLPVFLKNEYGISMPPISKGDFSLAKFSSAIRSLMYYDENRFSKVEDSSKIYYEELQWYIEKNSVYGFAVKAGNNAEEHNHNDIGSFMVVYNKRVIFSELGAGEYTADYCGENRYTCLEPSALGHSIPIINDSFQLQGKEYYGNMTVNGNCVKVDMSNAYPINIAKFYRQFEMLEDRILLIDSYDVELNVKERFITEIEPIITSDGCVKIADVSLCVPSCWDVNCSYETRKKHDGKTERKIFILDFTPRKQTDSFKMEIRFK